MMKLLAIDSTTEACSVALLEDNACREIYKLAPREHSQQLLPMVDQILADSETSLKQLDGIAFGCGPGSFTGLRICAGLVQGLAYGADLPVVPISSLAALAQTAFDQQQVKSDQHLIAAIDARMDELYWQCFYFEKGLATAIESTPKERLSPPEQLISPIENKSSSGVVGVGSGWNYADRIAFKPIDHCDPELLPRASGVVALAQRDFQQGLLLSADEAIPTYVRNEVTWKKINEQ